MNIYIHRAGAAEIPSAASADAGVCMDFAGCAPSGESDFQSAQLLPMVAEHLAGSLLEGVPISSQRKVGLFLGTTLGSLEIDREFDRSRREAGGRFASPAAFSRTLPSALAAELSVRLKIEGPVLVVAAGNASASLAIRRAAAWMSHMQLPYCIAGGFDHTGNTLREPPSQRIAVALLSTEPDRAIASVITGPAFSPDLLAESDATLDHLRAWIKRPHTKLSMTGVNICPIA